MLSCMVNPAECNQREVRLAHQILSQVLDAMVCQYQFSLILAKIWVFLSLTSMSLFSCHGNFVFALMVMLLIRHMTDFLLTSR